jgi:hypothetical protein
VVSPEQNGTQLMLHLEGPLSRLVIDARRPPKLGNNSVAVKVETLDSLLEQHGIAHIDFLSIHTEGFELNVLRGVTLRRYRPRLIVIEDHGVSGANCSYLARNGYRLVSRTGCNDSYGPRGSAFPVPFRERLRLRARTSRPWFRELLAQASRHQTCRLVSPGHWEASY